MISIESLSDESKKREVVYRSHGQAEYGYITSWNKSYIFVRYHLSKFDDGTVRSRFGQTSEATSPEDLEWCQPAVTR